MYIRESVDVIMTRHFKMTNEFQITLFILPIKIYKQKNIQHISLSISKIYLSSVIIPNFSFYLYMRTSHFHFYVLQISQSI